MITINILLGVLVLLFGYRYYELCEDMQKMREDIDKLKKEIDRVDVFRYSGHTELKEQLKDIRNKLNPLSYD
jgi:hypothetical protein